MPAPVNGEVQRRRGPGAVLARSARSVTGPMPRIATECYALARQWKDVTVTPRLFVRACAFLREQFRRARSASQQEPLVLLIVWPTQ